MEEKKLSEPEKTHIYGNEMCVCAQVWNDGLSYK